MASLRDNYLVAFLFVAILTASAVHSDPYDCKEVQCPTEIKCPADSILRVTPETTRFDDNTKNSIDADDDVSYHDETDDKSKNAEHNRRHTSRFFVEKSNDNHYPRQLNKRSLQYKRRESIKIVPGDYISLVPELVRYHPQLHSPSQNHHKWKRSISDSDLIDDYDATPTVSDVEKCCPKMTCVCTGNCPLPKCFKANQVPYQRTPNSDIPGKCCPHFQCIDEPNCANVNGTIYFWMTKCKKCTCVSGHKMCHKECDDESGCYSENLRKFFSNGISWQDDPCTQCQCLNGERKCQTSFCKPLNCQTKIKIEGECCLMCAPEISSTAPTISTTNSIILSTKEADDDVVQTTTTSKPSTPITTTASSSNISTTISQSPSTTITPSSMSPSDTPTSSVDTPIMTSEIDYTTISTTSSTTAAASTTEVISTTLSSTSFQSATTQNTVLSTVAAKSESPPILNATDTPTEPSTTELSKPPISIHTTTERILYFNTDIESIILYTVIVILLVVCCIFAGLYINEVTKRQTYSSIPNSDSNLSQMPRPKTEESA